MPLGLVATNWPSSGDQATDVHAMTSAGVRDVHAVPLGDVITRGPLLPVPTATNRPSSAAQVTSYQLLRLAAVRGVHVMPSGDVITRWAPDWPTATNSARSGDQHTDHQAFA